MKRRLISLGICCGLLLAGCQSLYPESYVSVNEHEAPFAYREQTESLTPETEAEARPELAVASRDIDIREIIQGFVMEGRETGQILLKDYRGNVDEDMKNMFNFMLSDSPKYNYAMDQFDWSLHRTQAGVVVTVEMQLRLTPQELQAIETRIFPEPAISEICKALRQQLSSYTVQVSGYQDTDLVAKLEDYILHHPDQIVEAPGISAAVYPDRGNLRVVELHFIHQSDRETLRARTEETNAFLNPIYHQLTAAQGAKARVETLYKLLVPSYGYISDPEATVYSQVVQKLGSSRTMASVVEYLCKRAGENCEIVKGLRDGEAWFWNRIAVEGQWAYFDLHAAALRGEPPLLMSAGEMEGYEWDETLYPELAPAVPEGGITPPPPESETVPIPTESETAPLPAESETSTVPTERETAPAPLESESPLPSAEGESESTAAPTEAPETETGTGE